MIDWHSHILPAVDDGSQSVEESIEMLDMLTILSTQQMHTEWDIQMHMKLKQKKN